jgi:hypothetical protein
MKTEIVQGIVQLIFAAVVAGIAWAACAAANWDIGDKILIAIFAYLAPSPLQKLGASLVQPKVEGEVK